jgi:predicted ester cyclase
MPHYPNRVKNEAQVIATNKFVARRTTAAFSFGEGDVAASYMDPNIIEHSPHEPEAQGVENEIQARVEMFPDQHFVEELLIAEGDMVFIGWEGFGTNTGGLMGHKPTGRILHVHGGEVIRLRNGKVIEHWDHYMKPRLEALAKIGMLDRAMMDDLGHFDML